MEPTRVRAVRVTSPPPIQHLDPSPHHHHLARLQAQAQQQSQEKVMRIEMAPDGSLIYREVEPEEEGTSGGVSGEESP